MDGLMMDVPLTVPSILERAAQYYPEKEIVSRRPDGTIHRTSYGVLHGRVARLRAALRSLGVRPGDRVASFAWNHHRHLELYFAVPGIGAVLHTANVRLSLDQLRYTINHARDGVVVVDGCLAGQLAELVDDLRTVAHYVILGDGHPPPDLLGSVHDYEDLLAAAPESGTAPLVREEMAALLCYTSGTTGDPKGVLYSHRALYLHAMSSCMVDTFAIGERETVLPVVPMFHANAWCLPFACTLVGAKQVYATGAHVLGRPLAELIERERVTWAAGVPTVWTLMYQYLRQHPHDLSSLKTIVVAGSALPRALIEAYERDLGIALVQAWGMTELTPVGTVGRLKRAMEDWPHQRQIEARAKQGLPVAGVEARILDVRDQDLPHDGRSAGELVVRGPWVARAYYEAPAVGSAFTPDGWFRTGDVATIDPHGYIQITDRIKDLVKSKGEWISSVDMENALVAHPGVLEAAVVARPDPKRDEVPAVFVVPDDDPRHPVTAEDLLRLLEGRFARWQLPRRADIHFVAALPKTSVGKLDKKALRRLVADAPPAPRVDAHRAQVRHEPAAGEGRS